MGENEKAAEKAMTPHLHEIGERDYEDIMGVVKGNPRYIPFKEVFEKKSRQLNINANAIELYIETGRHMIPARYKAMFDTHCAPDFRSLSSKQKLARCSRILKLLLERNNPIRMEQGKPEIKYQPYNKNELEAFGMFVRTHPKVRIAINMAIMHRDHAEHFVDDLEMMRRAAIESGDPKEMKLYQDTFVKISDFYMKTNMIYEQQKMKLDIKKYRHLARISRRIGMRADNGTKVIEISKNNYERKEQNNGGSDKQKGLG